MGIGSVKNFPGPYQLRIFYSVTVSSVVLQHKLQLNCAPQTDPPPGTLFGAINIVNNVGGISTLQTETDFIIALLQPLYNIGATAFDFAELWKFEPGGEEASFVSAYTIGLAGSSGSTNVVASEDIFIFRTTEGGVMKVYLEECVNVPGPSVGYAGAGAPRQALIDYFNATPSAAFFLGRDTSYPFAFNLYHPGRNEAIWKKRYRP